MDAHNLKYIKENCLKLDSTIKGGFVLKDSEGERVGGVTKIKVEQDSEDMSNGVARVEAELWVNTEADVDKDMVKEMMDEEDEN